MTSSGLLWCSEAVQDEARLDRAEWDQKIDLGNETGEKQKGMRTFPMSGTNATFVYQCMVSRFESFCLSVSSLGKFAKLASHHTGQLTAHHPDHSRLPGSGNVFNTSVADFILVVGHYQTLIE
jgi:hypothetical protein